MVATNTELDSSFQKFSQNFDETKKTFQQLNESVCSIEVKLEH